GGDCCSRSRTRAYPLYVYHYRLPYFPRRPALRAWASALTLLVLLLEWAGAAAGRKAANIAYLAPRPTVGNMTPKQIIIIAIGVAALAGGVTYLVMLIGPTGGQGTAPVDPQKIPAPIEISVPLGPRFEEAFTAGNHPFPFRSIVDKPTTVGIN